MPVVGLSARQIRQRVEEAEKIFPSTRVSSARWGYLFFLRHSEVIRRFVENTGVLPSAGAVWECREFLRFSAWNVESVFFLVASYSDRSKKRFIYGLFGFVEPKGGGRRSVVGDKQEAEALEAENIHLLTSPNPRGKEILSNLALEKLITANIQTLQKNLKNPDFHTHYQETRELITKLEETFKLIKQETADWVAQGNREALQDYLDKKNPENSTEAFFKLITVP